MRHPTGYNFFLMEVGAWEERPGRYGRGPRLRMVRVCVRTPLEQMVRGGSPPLTNGEGGTPPLTNGEGGGSPPLTNGEGWGGP